VRGATVGVDFFRVFGLAPHGGWRCTREHRTIDRIDDTPWVIWCFHPDESPQLLRDWSYAPMAAGARFRELRLKQAAAEKP
jgi:hypothetical protein